MNDKEFDRWLEASRERWRPFYEWSGKIEQRIQRLGVRTKLMLAKSAYLKAQTERRAWQGAATGRRVEIATRVAPDETQEGDKGGKPRKRAGRSAASR